jgi:hypothetical protein
MPDYSKGKVYIIRAPGTDRVYIGSTVLPLAKRLYQHRRLQGGCRSRELVTIPGHTIELLEDYPCSTVEELRKREGHHIREHAGRAINKNIAGRTGREYMAEHAEKYRARANEWYRNNKDRRRAYEAQTREYRLAWMRNYYQTVLKPRRDALRSAAFAAAVADGSAIDTPAWALPPAATLNPTSVAAASVCGV